MRANHLLVAGVLLLGAAAPLWAGPFAEVPVDHWGYQACSRLISLGLLPSERADGFSGDVPLTRFEFGMALLDPLGSIEEALEAAGPKSGRRARLSAVNRALGISSRHSEEELAGGLADLERLATEFSDVLRELGFDPEPVAGALGSLADRDLIQAWRTDALSQPTSIPALTSTRTAATGAEGIQVPVGSGTVELSLTSSQRAPELLDYLARSAARSAAAGEPVPTAAEPAIADPRISRLRTAYEYGLGSALTLSLAYEDIARRGQGLIPLDEASLTSVGIGYRLTPSTSVKLSYSLLEYSNLALDTPLVRDRLTETEVSVEF